MLPITAAATIGVFPFRSLPAKRAAPEEIMTVARAFSVNFHICHRSVRTIVGTANATEAGSLIGPPQLLAPSLKVFSLPAGDGGAVSWHGSARAISLLFPLQ